MFFQKHPETKMPGMTELDPALWPGHAALLAVDSATALVAAAQMNTVESVGATRPIKSRTFCIAARSRS